MAKEDSRLRESEGGRKRGYIRGGFVVGGIHNCIFYQLTSSDSTHGHGGETEEVFVGSLIGNSC